MSANDAAAALVAALEKDPGDTLALLAWADLLEEAGASVSAAGLRLAAKNRWHPLNAPVFMGGRWWWSRRRALPRRRRRHWQLPFWLWQLLPGGYHGDVRTQDTCAEAWAAYLEAFRYAVKSGLWPRPRRPVS